MFGTQRLYLERDARRMLIADGAVLAKADTDPILVARLRAVLGRRVELERDRDLFEGF